MTLSPKSSSGHVECGFDKPAKMFRFCTEHFSICNFFQTFSAKVLLTIIKPKIGSCWMMKPTFLHDNMVQFFHESLNRKPFTWEDFSKDNLLLFFFASKSCWAEFVEKASRYYRSRFSNSKFCKTISLVIVSGAPPSAPYLREAKQWRNNRFGSFSWNPECVNIAKNLDPSRCSNSFSQQILDEFLHLDLDHKNSTFEGHRQKNIDYSFCRSLDTSIMPEVLKILTHLDLKIHNFSILLVFSAEKEWSLFRHPNHRNFSSFHFQLKLVNHRSIFLQLINWFFKFL